MRRHACLQKQERWTSRALFSLIFFLYTWAETVSECHIEGGKPGDSVGAIRNARIGTTDIYHRQRLLAYSDLDRFYTYEFCDPLPYPVRNCVITLRITPITDGNRAFVEWSATFDCDPAEYDHWTAYFANEVWSKLLESLKRRLSHP
ncbi:MAG: SRPBCC family protein [Ktedonobacteraceae bacterium]|nr:SRPBCC family protein [Ktedonobacteraceae bacterium]